MSTHIEFQEHFAGNAKLFISIWVWLLLLTALEVFLGYIHLPVAYMLVILMGASIIKAALVAYNLFAAGSIISTDGLFFTVVPLVLGLSLLAVPTMDFLAKRKEAKLAAATSEGTAVASSEVDDLSTHEETHEHFAGSNRLFLSVWGWLLLLTAL